MSYRCKIKAQLKGLILLPQAWGLCNPDNPPGDTSDLHQCKKKNKTELVSDK